MIFTNLFEVKQSREEGILSSLSTTAGTTHLGKSQRMAGCCDVRMIDGGRRQEPGDGIDGGGTVANGNPAAHNYPKSLAEVSNNY
jgi:hypothetical protein